METRVKAWVGKECHCSYCGSSVIFTNDSSKGRDYFLYCCNKDCPYHKGQPVYDDEFPEWLCLEDD